MKDFTNELMHRAGQKVRSLRIAKKMTQQELAFMLDVSRACVSSWELGYRPLTKQNIKKLAEYFEISYEDLFGMKHEEMSRAILETIDFQTLNLDGLLQMKKLYEQLKNDPAYQISSKK